MSFMDEYNELKKKRKKDEEAKSSGQSSGSSFMGEYNKLKEQRVAEMMEEFAPQIAAREIKPTEEVDDRWVKADLFGDGYQFGDVSKTLLGTVSDVVEGLQAGLLEIGESAVDAGAYLVGGAGGLVGAKGFQEDMQEFIQKDLYDGRKIAKDANLADPILRAFGTDAEEASLLGGKADSIVESGGQLLGTVGLQAVGVPWWLTTGVTSFGSEADNALDQGATYGEAGLSATITAGAEILTEKISGGIKFGGNTLDDALTKKLSRNISNKVVRTATKLGIDVAGEGGEEVLSGLMSAVGQKITYADEEELNELFSSEDAWDAFIGGAALGGFSSGTNAIKSGKHGVDATSGMTANEEAVFKKVYNERVAEAKKDGKISGQEKNKIHDEVLLDMQKGRISTDTIEEVLGGESYKAYKDAFDSEKAMRKEYDELYNRKNGDKSSKEVDREAELKKLLEEANTSNKLGNLKTKLGDDVLGVLKSDAKGKGSRLLESYNEKARRGQAFEADVTKYDAKQRAVIQKAIDSGILNNTTRAHEFVDMVAKISADKGVLFDFTDNAKLKDSGFSVDGKVVNGYVTKDGITVNIDSAKSLNSVVGHEITHVLEGTDFYNALKQTVFDYAKSKGDYQSRYDSLSELYKNVKDANLESELVADMVGDYLFTDPDFINNLSVNHRNIFQKIFDEIKYLCNLATAGSKEARELEKVKRAFEDAYRGNGATKDSKTEKAQKKEKPVNKEKKANKETAIKSQSEIAAETEAEIDAPITEDAPLPNSKNVENGKHTTKDDLTFQTKNELNKFFSEIGAKGFKVKTENGKFVLYDGYYDVARSDTAQGIFEEFCEWEDIESGEDIYSKYQAKYLSPVVGHEIPHVLEGTEVDEKTESSTKYSLAGRNTPTYEELADKNPVKIVNVKGGIESGSYADMKTAAKSKAKREGWFDNPHHNEDTDSLIFLTEKSFSHAYSNLTADFGEDTIRCMAHIPEIIQNAVLVSVDNPRDPTKQESKVYTFFGAIDGAGGIEPVKLTVKEFDFSTLSAVPQNIRSYFEKNGVMESFDSLYDAHALEVVGIEGIKKESDASGEVYEQGSEARATSDSKISIADLLNLVKGDATKYIPKKQYSLSDSDGKQLSEGQGHDGVIFENIVDNGGYSNGSEGVPTVAIALNDNQIESTANAKPAGDADIRYSLKEIVDQNKKSYGVGVHLDSTLLDDLTPTERIGMVKEYVKELGGRTFTAYDKSGNEIDITIAKPNAKFKNQNGKRTPANKDLSTKYIGNEVKQESIALIDELIVTAEFDGSKAPQYAHDWLDNNGRNDWEYWTTYIQDKNNTIWEATLNVANAADGKRILYDISPIKKVGRSVESDTFPTNNNITQGSGDVKHSVSNIGQKPKSYGRYNVFGKDISLDDDIGPVAVADNTTTNATVSEKEIVAPVAGENAASPTGVLDAKQEKTVNQVYNRLEREKAELAEKFKRKKAELQESLKDKNAYISNKASELYNEIRNLKKGVKASEQLGYLLDSGYDWSSIRSALVNIKHTPDRTVNKNSAVESIAREMLNEDYENSVYELDSLDSEYQKQVKELESNAAKVYSEAPQRTTRKELHQGIVDSVKSRFAETGLDFDDVLRNAKNLSTFATVDNTPQRVMEKALGYKGGQVLSDLTVNKVAQNETEGIKWLNSFTDRKNGLLAQISKQYNIKPGSKESAAAQMYAEGFYVDKNNNIIQYGDAELAKDFPNAKVQANIKGLAGDQRIRQIYDDTLAMINESRKRNAYPEIPRLDNYFLHFRAMEDTFSRLGLPFNPNDIRAKDLPTDLNGVTADLKPGQPYFASAMHRTGKRTSFDLLGGLERYLSSAKNQIYHIDDIQTLRALRNYVADTYGQANGLEGLDALSEEEAQDRIEKVYNSHLSTFAKFLNEEANILAGKTALIDRGLEGIIGRRGITFLDTVNKQVGSNMVGFNVSSSLTNFLPVAQTFAKSNKTDFVKAFGQTVVNKVGSIFGRKDGFAENSPVVIRRKGADRFYRTPYQKIGDAGYVLMSAVDDISTELIARTKYNELTRKGMESQQAHYETDKWVSRLMGDRSLGQMPQLYNSKMLGLVTKFQLEVRNQLDSQFYDTIQETKASNEDIQNGLARNAKTAAKVASVFVQLAVVQHLFGKAFESVAGYNPAFDIIDALIKTFGWDDDEESEDTALDNIEQGFFTLLEDLPYTSTFTGGRIPIESALPIEQFIMGEDRYGNEKSRLETLGEIAPYYVLPGGYGQAKKSAQGWSMFDEDHPITGSYTDKGDLRFPVEDTFGNRLQAAIFGQWASGNAQDYFDNERTPLNEKQIQEFIDVGLSIQDYWEYREGLSGLKKQAEKVDYINSLDFTDEQKDVLKSYLFDEENYAKDNPEKYAFLESEGIGYLGYKQLDSETQDAWSWAFKHQDEYRYLKENGVYPGDYSVYRIPMLEFDDEGDEAYQWAFDNPEKATFGKVFGDGVKEYRKYTGDLYNIKADKDENGKSISGSRKEKVIDYINNMDADYGEKIILYKSQYPSDDSYNYEIIDYLNGRADISYEDMETILKELGFKVSSDGTITWD